MHIKRKTIPNFWPIARTGTKYMAVSSHNKTNSMPLIVVMRDILNSVKSSKELKKIVREKKILVNGKIVREDKYPLALFDSLAIPSINKFYKVVLKGKKYHLAEVSEKELSSRIYKVESRKVLPGKKIQINLSSGKNILSNEKIETGNFVLLKENKLAKIIKLEKGTEVLVVSGKHSGKSGKIISVEKIGEDKIAEISTKEGELKLNIDTLFALN